MVDFLIRADATPKMGVGHIMRCFALAQQCQKQQIKVVFVCAHLVDMCQQHLLSNHFEIHQLICAAGSAEEAAETIAIAKQYHAKAILFDGYHFSKVYFDIFAAEQIPLWMVDDFGQVPSYFKMVINFQAWADSSAYHSSCKQFLGLKYYFLRKAFWPYLLQQDSVASENRTILVMMGGTDPNQQTQRLLLILEKLSLPFNVILILGAKNPLLEQYVAKQRSHIPIELHTNPDNIPQLMHEALFAITAGGGTSWELAFMQVPSLVIVQADNQEKVAEYVQKLGVGFNLGFYTQLTDHVLEEALLTLGTDDGIRQKMRTAALKLNIGKNIHEIVNYIKAQCGTR